MKLKDIINLIDENATVFIITDEDEEPIAVYNGKDSIDSCNGDYEVVKIIAEAHDGIDILITT